MPFQSILAYDNLSDSDFTFSIAVTGGSGTITDDTSLDTLQKVVTRIKKLEIGSY